MAFQACRHQVVHAVILTQVVWQGLCRDSGGTLLGLKVAVEAPWALLGVLCQERRRSAQG